jgi:hypothetical protein
LRHNRRAKCESGNNGQQFVCQRAKHSPLSYRKSKQQKRLRPANKGWPLSDSVPTGCPSYSRS